MIYLNMQIAIKNSSIADVRIVGYSTSTSHSLIPQFTNRKHCNNKKENALDLHFVSMTLQCKGVGVFII